MAPEILLIDDDAYASALRKRVLERHGYRAQLALDAMSGIALADALHPALILMDHRLPDLIGPLLLQRLKEIRPKTPIIVHSGFEFLCDQYAEQPDAFLTKGESVENMLGTVSKHLQQLGLAPQKEAA